MNQLVYWRLTVDTRLRTGSSTTSAFVCQFGRSRLRPRHTFEANLFRQEPPPPRIPEVIFDQFLRAVGGTWFFAVLFCIQLAGPSYADTVWLKNDATPIHGRITRIGPDVIVLELTATNVTSETLPRSGIRTWHRSIDPARLESLGPESPAGYLDYAEELAGFRFDPVAIELSRRLAVIALHLDIKNNNDGKTGPTVAMQSLVILCNLERDESVRNKLIRFGIAHGLVEGANEGGTGTIETTPDPELPDRNAAALLLEQVRKIRRGMVWATPGVQMVGLEQLDLQEWQMIMTLDELQDCASATSLSSTQKLKLVRLETAIVDFLQSGSQPPQDVGWATTSRFPPVEIPQPMTAGILYGFDPDQCLWRDGKWYPAGK